MEFCEILPGQQFKRMVQDANLITAVLDFSKKQPVERLAMIKAAVQAVTIQNSLAVVSFSDPSHNPGRGVKI
jgi:hypothetical protein